MIPNAELTRNEVAMVREASNYIDGYLHGAQFKTLDELAERIPRNWKLIERIPDDGEKYGCIKLDYLNIRFMVSFNPFAGYLMVHNEVLWFSPKRNRWEATSMTGI